MTYDDDNLDVDEAALLRRPRISIIAVAFLMSTGAFGLVIFIERPLSRGMFAAVSMAALLGTITCLYRLVQWDVDRWQWRKQSATPRGCIHSPIWYRLTPLAVVLGVLTPRVLDRFVGMDFRVALILVISSYFSIISGWFLYEMIIHYWRRSRR